MIISGDQYRLPVTITKDGEDITPEEVQGIKLKINDTEYVYPDGGLDYIDNQWSIFLSQAETLAFGNNARMGVQVKLADGTTIRNSLVKNINIFESLFEKEW